MAAPRTSTEIAKSPHSLSLKVLRLARPALTIQHTLPKSFHDARFRPVREAAEAFPGSDADEHFMLTPGLKLPNAFGAVHVGEIFACTLCVNNDLRVDENDTKISDIDVQAEMQTPSSEDAVVALEVDGSESTETIKDTFMPGSTIQRIVRTHLAEEGNYILSVKVSYTETQRPSTAEAAPLSRRRSFAKTYRFPADHLLRVRIKTRPLPTLLESKLGSGFAIEAQLEKLGDESLVLDAVDFNAKAAFETRSLNAWNASAENLAKPILEAGDIFQLAYLVLRQSSDDTRLEYTADRKVLLGQMSIRWRRAMGESGVLNTGWLSAKPP